MGEEALMLLRRRICDPAFIHSAAKESPNSNYNLLKSIVSNTITEACSNSVLVLGPRGSGKAAVVDLVLEDLRAEHPDAISVVRLNGLLHWDDACALKETARQLCMEHHLLFSKVASSDDNSQFMIDMLRECALAHKTIVFVFDEFDLFTQGKQRLLYSLLDAMQTTNPQAAIVGISCRLDADQLLEKRVRSRFSHRKLVFVPLATEEIQNLLEYILYLPVDSTFSLNYAKKFNSSIYKILQEKKFKNLLDSLLNADRTVSTVLRFLFRAVANMDVNSGILTLENFKAAVSCIQRQPTLEILQGSSILELYILVCIYRLESREQDLYFGSIMKEYKAIHDAYKTYDYYNYAVCMRAFEHLLERELITFTDSKGRSQSIEFRPVKPLLSSVQLYQALKSYSSCPAILHKLLDHERFA